MKHALIAAGLLAGLITPLAAETAAPEAAPGATPAPEARPDPAERQRNSAAKLAGMIRFVAVDCPDAEPDYERFKAIISRMGVDIKDLENGPLMVQSLGYSQAYHKDQAAGCQKAFELFGEGGKMIPGLIARKDPKAAAPASKDEPKTGETKTGETKTGETKSEAPKSEAPKSEAPKKDETSGESGAAPKP